MMRSWCSTAAARDQGLTLIELVIGLAICAVLMSLAAPSLSAVLQRQRLKAAVQGLEVDLREARFEAVRRGATMHLSFSPGPDWCYAIATRPDCDCRLAQSCRLKAVRGTDLRGVQLVQALNTRFDPGTGNAESDSSGAIWQSKAGDRVRVSVSPMGRPTACVEGGVVPPLPSC